MPDIDVNLANPPLAPGPYVRLGAGSDWPKAPHPYRRNPGGPASPWGVAEFALLVLIVPL